VYKRQVYPQGISVLQGSFVSAFLTGFPPTWSRDVAFQTAYPRDCSTEVTGYPLTIELTATNPSTVSTDRTRIGLRRPLASSSPFFPWNMTPVSLLGPRASIAAWPVYDLVGNAPLVNLSAILTYPSPPPGTITTYQGNRPVDVVGRLPYHPFAAPAVTARVRFPSTGSGTFGAGQFIVVRATLFCVVLEPDSLVAVPELQVHSMDFVCAVGTTMSLSCDFTYLNDFPNTRSTISTPVMFALYPVKLDNLLPNYTAFIESVSFSTDVPQEPRIGAIGFFRCNARQINVDVAVTAEMTPAPSLVPFLAGAAVSLRK
jgi:hypothetical protein